MEHSEGVLETANGLDTPLSADHTDSDAEAQSQGTVRENNSRSGDEDDALGRLIRLQNMTDPLVATSFVVNLAATLQSGVYSSDTHLLHGLEIACDDYPLESDLRLIGRQRDVMMQLLKNLKDEEY